LRDSIKKLAGETAIYGLSSILGRILNYLLVIIHTRVFLPEAFGVVTELYSYVAIFMVLFTFGMETTFFRFTTRDKDPDIYKIATSWVLIVSFFMAGMIYLNASELESWLGIDNSAQYIKWLSIILFLDSFITIPFAKLRIENKPWKFAIAKLVMILLTVGLNIFFLTILPGLAEHNSAMAEFYDPTMGIGYIFLANLIGSASVYIILIRELFSIKLKLDLVKLKPMLIYAFPILLTGFAGMLNENLDKILFRNLFPSESGVLGQDALGIYGAAFKLSIFMMLGIQAFRYAAEPFFFNRTEQKDSKELFAKVLHYFVIVCLMVFVLVSLNVDLIGQIFLKKPQFWEALYVVPVLLLAKLIFGIYVNLSIWFKITDKTIFGTYFSLAGVAITIIFNLLLVPLIGYMGAALASLACYSTMTLLCYLQGQKHYPIPYKLKPILIHIILAGLYVALLFPFDLSWWINMLASVTYVLIIFLWEFRKKPLKKEF